MEQLISNLPEYIRIKKMVEDFENKKFMETVKPLTCICCQKEQVSPDFEFISKPEPENQDKNVCWNNGAVTRLSAGWGSRHDMSSYFMAVCDSCISVLEEKGLLKKVRDVQEDHKTNMSIQNKQGRIYSGDLPSYADLMTVEDWNQSVEEGWFISDDGHGYWVKDGMQSRDEVFSTPQQDATHVAWYNK